MEIKMKSILVFVSVVVIFISCNQKQYNTLHKSKIISLNTDSIENNINNNLKKDTSELWKDVKIKKIIDVKIMSSDDKFNFLIKTDSMLIKDLILITSISNFNFIIYTIIDEKYNCIDVICHLPTNGLKICQFTIFDMIGKKIPLYKLWFYMRVLP